MSDGVAIPPAPADTAARAALARAAAGELLSVADLAAIWHVRPGQIYRLARAGTFDAFKVKPAIGTRIFSGVLVTRYLRGEWVVPTPAPRFGRKTGAS